MQNIKIGLFDDHTIVTKGLEFFLSTQEGLEVVFSCENKQTLINNLEANKIDVLILDVVAQDIVGLELFEVVTKKFPQIKIIAFTSLTSIMLVENLLFIGVKGFVNKKQTPIDIINCIKSVYHNKTSVPEEYSSLLSKFNTLQNTVLSSREIEITALICKEFTSTQIAEKLFISPFTVENHRKAIFKKLQVKNLAGMIVALNKLGYIS